PGPDPRALWRAGEAIPSGFEWRGPFDGASACDRDPGIQGAEGVRSRLTGDLPETFAIAAVRFVPINVGEPLRTADAIARGGDLREVPDAWAGRCAGAGTLCCVAMWMWERLYQPKDTRDFSSMAVIDASDALLSLVPTKEVDARKTFGIDLDWKVPAFAEKSGYVPDLDPAYRFDPQTTRAILAGFKFNRRVMIQGYHGTGKSTHIEQVAARLNWPMIRINLDSHVSRIDLVGKDAIVLKDGKQLTEFREGILPWALQRPIALVFDEYDAGRPDVMFVIQRILEASGQLTLLDQNRVMKPHPNFRLFATTNTVGLGDTTGLYHGTQQLNQGQLDRWSIVTTLNYLEHDAEVEIVAAKVPDLDKQTISKMVRVADMT